ncbi:metallophosphoesterase [Peptostreptococcus faecalis]|uniref:metallophosphoesterase n=1 Tax=Peptostreptococcus faecalis TaxID=2045015 RepID=UPI000C79DD35|nr:metallophosphoesterase [Peptostreptococcus faecalis]
MKKKLFIISLLSISVVSLFVLNKAVNQDAITVYYTTDLHSHFTNNLKEFTKSINHEKSLLLDAGDITDIQTEDDAEWSSGYKEYGPTEERIGSIVEKIAEPESGTAPVIKDMQNAGYDAAIIGNHEFMQSSDKTFISQFIEQKDKNSFPFLSANTYYNKKYIKKSSDERVTKPYIIKNLKTKFGTVKVGVIGVTTNTIFDRDELVNGKLIKNDEVLLQNGDLWKGKMYMTDMVEESIKVSKELKEKENPDVIVLVAHSGEKPKKPKHSGNRLQELAAKVPNIDLIIGGHTHEFIDNHEYKGPNGKKVVVTQSGCHAKGIGESKIKISKDNDKFVVKSVNAKNIKFEIDENDIEDSNFAESEKGFELMEKNAFNEKKYNELKKENPNVKIRFTIISKKKITLPNNIGNYQIDSVHKDEKDDIYIYYLFSEDYKVYKYLIDKYIEY